MRSESIEKLQQIGEAKKIVLEPENDFVLTHRLVERAFLTDQAVADAQKMFLMRRADESRARFDVDFARHRSGGQRFAKRQMLAGDSDASRSLADDVAVVDVNHGAIRTPIHQRVR